MSETIRGDNSIVPKRVILVRSNPVDRDPWLAKELDTLRRGKHAITLLYWDRDGGAPDIHQAETSGNFREIRLRLKAPWGVKILPLIPIWWAFVFFRLLAEKWDMAHAINLDSIIPAVIAARLKRRPVIYEIFDVYADLIMLPKWIRRTGIFIEKFYMRLANAVIIANEAQRKELNGIPNKNVIEIYNTPPDCFKKTGIPSNDVFTIFYAGVLYRSRPMNLEKVFQAIENINGVRLIIAGYGDQVNDIKRWADNTADKVKYIGRIGYEEVLERTMASNLLFALYDPSVAAVRHASCNKLFEAMMSQKPILVSKGTAMEDIVEREKCGITVDSGSTEQIGKAIVRLKENPELCRQLGQNGRKAYEQKYNREIMEQRLLELYHKMLNKNSQGRI